MERRRCILHIGICKTGTTSIQHALADHRDELALNGIIVPRCYGPTHNHRHVGLLAVDDETEHGRREWDVMRSRVPALAACTSSSEGREWMEQELLSEIGATPEECTVLFSSEQLSQRLLSDAEVWELRSAMERLGFFDIKVVMYVREQVGLALSWESMEVLAGGGIEGLSGSEIHLNHRVLVERWECVFGREALKIRTYASPCLERSDVVHDFMVHALGVAHQSETHSRQNWQNPRLGRRGIWFVRQANRFLPQILPAKAAEQCRRNLIYVGSMPWVGGKPKQAKEEEIKNARDIYRESNRWVDKRYGTKLEATFGQT